MSVSAFGSDFLQDSGINNLANLEEYTPNLKITPGQSTRSTSFKIRGIGSVGSNSGIDPSVGIFLDGVYQGRAGMSISDLIDVDGVETVLVEQPEHDPVNLLLPQRRRRAHQFSLDAAQPLHPRAPADPCQYSP